MPQPKVIGIAGRARSGKDTAANFVVAAIGGYSYGFADPIRQMLIPLGIDMTDPYWQQHKEDVIPAIGVSPRRMMQTLGTEWGRQLINKDLWLLMAYQRLKLMGPGMVVSDVRFENEATWIRDQGGLLIHLQRSQHESVEHHTSEAGVEVHESDYMLYNNGTLADLQHSVKVLLNVDD